MRSVLSDAWLIAQKDLAIEFRTRSAFLSAIVFALLSIVIFFFAWDSTAVAAIDLAPGVLWVIFTFSGLLGMHRSFGVGNRLRRLVDEFFRLAYVEHGRESALLA